jgi:hypothetical protein
MKRNSTLYYIKDFKAKANDIKDEINGIDILKVMKKKPFADIILEIGRDTVNKITD